MTKDGVRISIGYLQDVTTINYYTSADFHTTEHSTLNSSVCLR
jgi:hypothetical protein